MRIFSSNENILKVNNEDVKVTEKSWTHRANLPCHFNFFIVLSRNMLSGLLSFQEMGEEGMKDYFIVLSARTMMRHSVQKLSCI